MSVKARRRRHHYSSCNGVDVARSMRSTSHSIFKSNLILVSHWHLREKDPLSTNFVDACETSSMPTITREISRTRRNDNGVCADASKPRRPLYVVLVSNWVLFGKVEKVLSKVLSKLGDKERSSDPLTIISNQLFTVR
jgi:hypothetical protein